MPSIPYAVCRGIVLRETETKETDKILTVLTAEQGKLIGQAESGEALSSAKRKAWDRAEADDRLLDGLTAQAEEFQQARRADALWRSETFSTGTLPGLLMAEGSRAAMEVEDISRAVQRDARRYDGGFTMF